MHCTTVWTIVIRGVLTVASRILPWAIKPWLQRGLDKIDITVVSMSFNHIQATTPLIEVTIRFRNMSDFSIDIDRTVDAMAKLESGLATLGVDAETHFSSPLSMLHLKPHGEADDSSRINIVSNLAQKIQGHVKVGQSEKWEFDYVWQVKVNGQPFTLKRTLRHTQTPQVLTGI